MKKKSLMIIKLKKKKNLKPYNTNIQWTATQSPKRMK